MRIITNIIVRLCYTALPLLLFSFGLTWSIYMVLRTPQPLERALSQSGIYGSIIQNTVDEKQQETPSTLPLERPEIKTALHQAFSPQLLETNANRAIEATYDWVQGRTDALTIRIDLTDARTTFAQSVRSYVVQRTNTLPICSIAELRALGSTNALDPYNATCRPAQVTAESAGDAAYQEVMTNQTFGNSVFTTDSIKKSDGTTLSEQLKPVPEAYRWTLYIMYGSGLAALLCGIVIVIFRRKTWRQAAQHLSRILLTTGLLSTGLALVIGLGFSTVANLIAKSAQSEFIQAKIVYLVTYLAGVLQRWWLGYGIALVILAVILWAIRRLVRAQPVIHESSASGMSSTIPPIAPRDTNVRMS